MSTKTWTFSDLPAPEIELELEYIYSYDPGKYSGRPEDCYPEEEECEITLPANWEQYVIDCYMIEARKAMKEIESQVSGLEFDSAPAEWAAEERESYEEDRAEWMMEARRGN